jgi:hypothetical protein
MATLVFFWHLTSPGHTPKSTATNQFDMPDGRKQEPGG